MSLNNYDKESFEEKWRRSLANASEEPPAQVWEQIEARLAAQEQKHRLVAPFYKRLSIAAAFLIMALTATLWLQQAQYRQKEEALQAQLQSKNNTERDFEELDDEKILSESHSPLPTLSADIPAKAYSQNTFTNTKPEQLYIAPERFYATKALPAMAYSPAFRPPPFQKVHLQLIEPLQPPAEANTLWEDEAPQLAAAQQPSKNAKNTFWIGLDFMPIAANNTLNLNYQPVIASAAGRNVSGIDASKVNEELQQQSQAQFSYQTGFQIGYRFYKGFSLQSGIHYTALQSNITTNQYTEQNGQKYPSFLTLAKAEYAPQDNLIVMSGGRNAERNTITVNNQFEFLNIPLQVGYFVGKKKWRYGVAAGLSASLLLNSTFAGENDASIAPLSLQANSNSFYKPVFLSSMASVSVQYLLSDALRISLQPTYQQALESVARENSSLQSAPRLWGLNVGMHYAF